MSAFEQGFVFDYGSSSFAEAFLSLVYTSLGCLYSLAVCMDVYFLMRRSLFHRPGKILSWLKSTRLERLKASWLSDGWLRVGAREDRERGVLVLSGFLYPPKCGTHQRLQLSRGYRLKIEYGLFNRDHAYLGETAFEATVPLQDLESDEILSITATSEDSGHCIPWHQSWHLLPQDDLPFPSGSSQDRISEQSIDDQWFYFSGGSFVHKLAPVLDQYFSMDIADTESVLDWGCGCGRLTQHLKKYTNADIHGVDIDETNVKWCVENIPGINFNQVHPWEPLPYADSSFDLIIGHSVLTHLTEEAQYFWLAELSRVLSSGGALLVTVMSSRAILNDQLTDVEIRNLLKAGYLDVGHQPDGVDEIDPGYYRKVYHRPEYIRRCWDSCFEILDILDGYADHQALVVCRKR